MDPMGLLQIKNVNFTLNTGKNILKSINLTIKQGDFHIIFGPSGSGKTTLLKLLFQKLIADGQIEGDILINGQAIQQIEVRQLMREIAYVQQDPNEQIVFEDVLQELSFGLENSGVKSEDIELKIAEIISFFGIQHWIHEKTATLSGGQKQLLNLASALVLNPKILVLDEPTAQLDPLAAKEFIDLLKRVNDELGTTILIVEHRLEMLFPIASHVTLMQQGSIEVTSETVEIIDYLSQHQHLLREVLPPSLLLANDLGLKERPLTVKQGMQMLEKNRLRDDAVEKNRQRLKKEVVFAVNDCSFRYEKKSKDILKKVNFSIYQGEIITVFGNNGSGKTTLLKVISGHYHSYQGSIKINDRKLNKIKQSERNLVVLPQNPSTLFIEKTVLIDFQLYCKRLKIDESRIKEVEEQFKIADLMQHHPEDLSGGELQKVAIAKLLLSSPQIMFLDEATKGLDAYSKAQLAKILLDLKGKGMTILLVTHDLDFAAKIADACTLFFDGRLLAIEEPHVFFSKNHFYTPTVNRLAKPFFKDIIHYDELRHRCQKVLEERYKQ